MKHLTVSDGTNVALVTDKEIGVMDRGQYEEDLKRRQKEHLDSIQRQNNTNWQPCVHDQCPECHGTGTRKDGGMCVHGISCPCPKCTPTC